MENKSNVPGHNPEALLMVAQKKLMNEPHFYLLDKTLVHFISTVDNYQPSDTCFGAAYKDHLIEILTKIFALSADKNITSFNNPAIIEFLEQVYAVGDPSQTKYPERIAAAGYAADILGKVKLARFFKSAEFAFRSGGLKL